MSDPIESPLRTEPPKPRRTLIGPFTARQLVTALGIVVVAAVVLTLATRPIAAGPGAGATALPAATPFLVGPVVEGLRPGNEAPELAVTHDDGSTFQLTDLDGKPVRLEDLRGKLVWLNFWASWCPPCQGETPVLRDMDETYKDKGLEIVGVAVQETTVDDVRNYAQRYELGYRIAFDTSADIFRLYKVYALPTQFFIAPDGKIIEVVNGPLSHQDAAARIEAWLPKEPGATP
ncbi:MAG TPA: TlpA disulfide reductase family protein [Candidatus Limnocylindrales bacterium]|nr:TlpA disulfide reductase family protein [Candidatus Limnocylindrales bacterium]